MMMKRFALAGGFVCAAASVGLALAYVAGGNDRFASCRGDHGIDVSQIGGGFDFTDETGRPVSYEDVVTGPTILYFGYTFCPDVCPMDNMRNAEAAYLLEEQGLTLQTAFVSVDPERDTLEILRDFTDVFHPEMVGLTGTQGELAEVAEAYRTFYEAQEAEDGYYLIDHSTYSYILMPEDGVVEVVMRDTPADVVAQRATCIMEAA